MACRIDRRSFLRNSALAGAGAVGIRSLEEEGLLNLLAHPSGVHSLENQSGGSFEAPCGTIGKIKLSRIIAGGNIISGWCHQRDLLYVSALAARYLTEEKQFDTLELCEEQGVNACSPDPSQLPIIHKYQRQRGGQIQTVVGIRQEWEAFGNPSWQGLKDCIDRSVDQGATTLYTQGGYTEHAMKTGRPGNIEIIGKAIEYIKKQGLPAGLGCHDVKVIEIADDYGVEPDYYFKTFHHDNYWSAHPRERREPWSVDSERHKDHNKFHDNIFDLFPDRTLELMARKKQPWIAFKTLAAGAIPPKEAFEFCFQNGADFLAVGMFDFQVVEDVLIARNTLQMETVRNRKRPWRG